MFSDGYTDLNLAEKVNLRTTKTLANMREQRWGHEGFQDIELA